MNGRRNAVVVVAVLLLLLLVGGVWLAGHTGLDDEGTPVMLAPDGRGTAIGYLLPDASTDSSSRTRRIRDRGRGDDADGTDPLLGGDGTRAGGSGGGGADDGAQAGRAPGAGSGEGSAGAAAGGSVEPQSDFDPNESTRRAPVQITGKVLGLGTGEILAGARTLYCVCEDGRWVQWNGSTVEQDGTFEVNRPLVNLEDGQRFELWVSLPGYRMQRIPVGTDASMTIELERRTTPLIPGRITGTWTDMNGVPLSGMLLVAADFQDGTGIDQWTVADDAGRFVVEGTAPGYWRPAAYDVAVYGERVETIVPEDGEATVELRMKHTKAVLEAQGTPMSQEAAARRESQIYEAIGPFLEKPTSKQKSEEYYRLVEELQDVRYRARLSLPKRTVVVTGLPDVPHAWVRAEERPRHFWRERVTDGPVRFELRAHRWTFVLQVPGEDDVRKKVDVKAGDGALTVDFGMGESRTGR